MYFHVMMQIIRNKLMIIRKDYGEWPFVWFMEMINLFD